jgi:hypothetical protein
MTLNSQKADKWLDFDKTYNFPLDLRALCPLQCVVMVSTRMQSTLSTSNCDVGQGALRGNRASYLHFVDDSDGLVRFIVGGYLELIKL